ncbi:MAG: hypothetical protein A3H96_05325 [Acidobacteria bacterium RIFCSPLOWO2_02_FULL_67_36]|nr:MAG: hypothetical protein A3H96_05325 [Acidobacteria bacterium RIFCSPLOWO2_02_FULL_67_36]OFW21662.1 MAG: hypothetical protein A3G21_14805 [Acidobacteria bacterium RIFCSPLOWO2_12_FULL_66_21]
MHTRQVRVAARLGAVLSLVAAVSGQQQNVPHAGYVYPAGGQRGTRVQVKVGGQFLDGVSGVLVSGPGVQASVVAHDKPLNQRQIMELRDKLQALQKTPADPAARKEMIEIRDRVGDSVRRNAAPVLSEFVTIDVAIDVSAEPGARSLRLATPLGLTNPLVFVVGELSEFRELDVKNTKADAELGITIPAVVNGRVIPGDIDRVRFPLRQGPQYMPGDVDRYRFMARKGQRLVAAVSARDLIPYLADAVPGWFQSTVALFDGNGKEIAYQDDDRYRPDPVLQCEIPADGEYVLEIRDALYRGREDFVYRIAIGERPVVGGALPRRENTRTMEPGAADRAGVAEREPNNSAREAQKVRLPIVVDGRIQQAADHDVFSFEGRAGNAIVAEVHARRLDSPVDSALELVDAAGRRVAFNDDHDDKGFGLLTHQADSLVMATLPATGTYFVRLWDVQRKSGPEYAYRLRIGPPAPDFALWVTPSTINAIGGTTIPMTVYARRDDGFDGDIALSLDGAPGGFRLAGGVLPGGQDRVRVTLTVPPVPGPNVMRPPVPIALQGRATIRGKDLVRRATPADDMMQAFAYRHLVQADALRVAIVARGGLRAALRIAPERAALKQGASVPIKVALPPGYRAFEHLQFELSDPPDGITLGDVALEDGGATFVLRADAAKAKTGLKGNLIVTISGERVPPAGQQPPPRRRRIVLGTLPAIPFEILKPGAP